MSQVLEFSALIGVLHFHFLSTSFFWVLLSLLCELSPEFWTFFYRATFRARPVFFIGSLCERPGLYAKLYWENIPPQASHLRFMRDALWLFEMELILLKTVLAFPMPHFMSLALMKTYFRILNENRKKRPVQRVQTKIRRLDFICNIVVFCDKFFCLNLIKYLSSIWPHSPSF